MPSRRLIVHDTVDRVEQPECVPATFDLPLARYPTGVQFSRPQTLEILNASFIVLLGRPSHRASFRSNHHTAGDLLRRSYRDCRPAIAGIESPAASRGATRRSPHACRQINVFDRDRNAVQARVCILALRVLKPLERQLNHALLKRRQRAVLPNRMTFGKNHQPTLSLRQQLPRHRERRAIQRPACDRVQPSRGISHRLIGACSNTSTAATKL